MWNDTDAPLAYFISFLTYGTWLHEDKRASIDRFHNRYLAPYVPPNEKLTSEALPKLLTMYSTVRAMTCQTLMIEHH
jgi:hypothetical protein